MICKICGSRYRVFEVYPELHIKDYCIRCLGGIDGSWFKKLWVNRK